MRQWVCSLPWRLRVLCGYDRHLCAEVLEAFVVGRSRSLKRRAKQSLGLATVGQAHTGAVSVIQRGDSDLRLNVHFHLLALDGVCVREEPSAPLVFHPLPAPTVDEVTDVAERTALRVQKILERHGRSLDGTGDLDANDAQSQEQLALSACYGAAAAGLGPDGERAGRPLLRVVDPSRARNAERHDTRRDCALAREARAGSATPAQASAARPAPARVPQGLTCSTRVRNTALLGRGPSSMRLHGPGMPREEPSGTSPNLDRRSSASAKRSGWAFRRCASYPHGGSPASKSLSARAANHRGRQHWPPQLVPTQ